MKRLIMAAIMAVPATLLALNVGAGGENPRFFTANGLTWQQIADTHQVNVDELQLFNNLAASTSNTAVPRVGWNLHIPEAGTTTTPTSTTSTTTTTVPATTTTVPVTTTTTTQPSTTTTTTPPSGEGFVETFASISSMDRFVTHVGNYCSNGTSCRPENNSGGVEEFPGDHDHSCAAPTTTRIVNVSVHSNLFWHCAPNGPDSGHVMIGNDMSGYGIASISPNQTFSNVNRICWDLNHTNLGGGKWFNIVVVPESFYLAHPNENPLRVQDEEGPYRMDYTSPGFNADNSPGDFNIQGGPTFGFKQFLTQRALWTNNASDSFVFNTYGEHNAEDDKVARYKSCLIETATGIRIELTDNQGVWTFNVNGAFFPSGPVRVVFQDDTYDSIKHDGRPQFKTWHLDNILIDVD